MRHMLPLLPSGAVQLFTWASERVDVHVQPAVTANSYGSVATHTDHSCRRTNHVALLWLTELLGSIVCCLEAYVPLFCIAGLKLWLR
jgi:hypothetical protein